MEKKNLDLFARVDILVLQPIACNVLVQPHHSLGEQFGIGLSDLSSRHSLFQQGSQSYGALVTGPDRKRPHRGVHVTDTVVVKKPSLVFFNKIQIGVQDRKSTRLNSSHLGISY